MNITLLAAFASTFMLIDSDISMTRTGIYNYNGGEGNPIARIFTDRDAWGELTIAAYFGNAILFFGFTALGKSLKYQMQIAHPEMNSEIIVLAFQCIYIAAISYAEIFAVSLWSTRGVPVDVKVTPLVILF